jgi:hypothetical protein
VGEYFAIGAALAADPRLISEQSDLTLNEIVSTLRKRRIPGSRSALSRFFARHRITITKSLRAAERKRADVARARLLEAGVLGVEAESNFRHQSDLPERALATLHEMLLQHGLLVFDMGFNRIPRASFQRALVRNGLQDHCG